ncbi:hypothetical protein FRB94_003803 [Tulasnella sp. JGI-2019a]|nr:hypothetical protein FRB94_003803 [Tulasnella sp. JGI-2019a]
MVRTNGEDDLSHREWLEIFNKVIEEVREEMKVQGRDDEFVGAKVIYTTLRVISNDELDWYLNDCLTLKKEFPHLVAGNYAVRIFIHLTHRLTNLTGFDLVGQEGLGHPLIYYLPKLLQFQKRVKSEGLSIPFIFHAGETLGDGDHSDDNLYDAILLGTKRIGHG